MITVKSRNFSCYYPIYVGQTFSALINKTKKKKNQLTVVIYFVEIN